MSGDIIKVTYSTIQSMADNIKSQTSVVEGNLESLTSAITTLGNTWTGGANEAFTAVQKKWNTDAEDLKQVLGAIGAAVNAALQAYQETEAANTRAWG